MAKNGHRRALLLLTATMAAATALAGCGTPSNVGETSSSDAVSSTGTSSSPSSSATADTNSASASTDASSTAAPGLCNASMLAGSVDDTGGGAAGHIYMKLIVKNTSSQTCIIDGYPGVSLVGSGNGTQIGAPADRDATLPSEGPVTLNPGATATAQLRYTQAGDYQNCTQKPADGLRVYPPSATDALFIAHPLTGCSESSIVLLTIGAFKAS